MASYEYKDLAILELEVSKAKKNNKDSKKYVVDFFEPFIIKMCKKTFIKNMDQDDIKQNLILSLLIAIEKYDSKNKFFWYAIQAMKNNLYRELKKIKREDGNITIDKLPIADPSYIEDNLIKEEEIEELKRILFELDKNDYEIIEKSYFEDYDLNKLSSYFNVSYNTIATRKSRVIKKIKLLM